MIEFSDIRKIIDGLSIKTSELNKSTVTNAVYHLLLNYDESSHRFKIATSRIYIELSDSFDTSVKAIESKLNRFQRDFNKTMSKELEEAITDKCIVSIEDMSNGQFLRVLADYVMSKF